MSPKASSRRVNSAPPPRRFRTPACWVAAVLGLAAVAVLFVVGLRTLNSQAPQQAGQDQIFGRVASGTAPAVTPIGEAARRDGTQVTVRGRIVDMGPAMGCWLVIDDGTGQVLVQTDPMLVIDPSVMGRTLTATGEVGVVDGGMGFTGRRLQVLVAGVRIAAGTG